MMKQNIWNEQELNKLYWEDERTKQSIADEKGVTRQRVDQKMKQFGIPGRKRGWHLKQKKRKFNKINSLNEYFEYVRKTRQEVLFLLRKYILPYKKKCEECGSIKNLHTHRLRHPAQKLSDLQILCCSCHMAKHRKHNGYKIQLEICQKYSNGKKVSNLASEYKVNKSLIYRILRKWGIALTPGMGRPRKS